MKLDKYSSNSRDNELSPRLREPTPHGISQPMAHFTAHLSAEKELIYGYTPSNKGKKRREERMVGGGGGVT